MRMLGRESCPDTMPSGNNPLCFDLIFERIDNASVLSNFVCGIKEMDDFIHTRLQSYIDSTNSETYKISMKDEIVAMLTLKEDSLQLDDDDKDDMRHGFVPKPQIALDLPFYLKDTIFPSIEIAYLAVSVKHQIKGIGKYILEAVERKTKTEHPDCQFITVDAYIGDGYSAVGFYSKCRFEPLELPHGGYKNTLRMYKVLSPVRQLDEYD